MANRGRAHLFKLILLSLLLGGCAPPMDDGLLVTECVLPEDQSGTLSGRWKVQPIPIAFRSGQFGSTTKDAIVKAADTWNSFFKKSQGIQILDYGDPDSPRETSSNKSSSLCTQSIVSDSAYVGSVVIRAYSDWPYDEDAIAMTVFCPQPDTPLNSMYNGIMELNFEHYFVNGTKVPDMTSLLIHEFGHLVGLNHSCETLSTPNTPDCDDSSLPNEYFEAVMFPVVFFDQSGFGELRRTLKRNDQGRANCLYQDLKAE